MKRVVFDKKSGKLFYLDVDPEELNTEIVTTWHQDSKNWRVGFPVETYNANLQKLLAHNLGLEYHPFLVALVTAVQDGAFMRVTADEFVYYYCEYVEEVDEAIIINYGGYVEPKPS